MISKFLIENPRKDSDLCIVKKVIAETKKNSFVLGNQTKFKEGLGFVILSL